MQRISAALIALAAGVAPGAAIAAEQRPSLQSSFALGGGDSLCRVQSAVRDPAIKTMFDRVYSIVCRDAAQAVGRVYALRKDGGDPAARLAAMRGERVNCAASAAATLEGLKATSAQDCTLKEGDVRYRVYSQDAGKTVFVAEGLAGYDSALTLALRSIAADRIIPGRISIAATEMGDPAAFARIQAGTLDLDEALDEGYRRNNSGSYAEAAEFFDTLAQRGSAVEQDRAKLAEYRMNRALQRSNLGAFAEADRLFAQAEAIPTSDPVQLRLRRNYVALHLMNQRKNAEARAALARPVGSAPAADLVVGKTAVISPTAAALLNDAVPITQQLTGERAARLTPAERVRILDAQAALLEGTTLRLEKRPADASAKLTAALAELGAIRDGRVTSVARLRAQGLNEQSLIAEEAGRFPDAERLLREAITVLGSEYPQSVALAASKGRLAAYFARRGQTDAALGLYKELVTDAGDSLLASNIPLDVLSPYFDVLARTIPARPALVEDFFLAGETLIRPGVAQTQAILARELSAGNDEAARLFRQAVTLTREVEQKRVAVARLAAQPTSPEVGAALATVRAELQKAEADQAVVQARLAEFPRYSAISTKALSITDLKGALRPGEAYVKMSELGGAVYAMLVTPTDATAYRVSLSSAEIEAAVDAIRGSISKVENGQQVTYPFDMERARRLYQSLFGPISDRMLAAKHIIFEPAGGMLKLPPNLLVTDDASVARYVTRSAAADSDGFDFRGTAWLGRDRDISTAVSARAFRDIRSAPPSRAKKEYLGLGRNEPVGPMVQLTGGTRSGTAQDDCSWGLSLWNNPISDAELKAARSVVGGDKAQLLTGELFTDTALKARRDLSDYRVLHFATHGLVAPPQPQCPSEPALMTSFAAAEADGGAPASDGLLSFREIFDLKIDADLVILSACDTAAEASTQATREVGLSGGGGFALDGLVRAFVGAGGRSVVASHWPAPDDYQATERLIGTLFTAPKGTAITTALRDGQRALMDAAETSHPYYWAGFSVIGDGTKPVLATTR